jgi:uncharacterized membrane protein YiaA
VVGKNISAMNFSYCNGAVKDMLTKLTWKIVYTSVTILMIGFWKEEINMCEKQSIVVKFFREFQLKRQGENVWQPL